MFSTRELHWHITVLTLEPLCFTVDFDSHRSPFKRQKSTRFFLSESVPGVANLIQKCREILSAVGVKS
jgi:hypothetical protein